MTLSDVPSGLKTLETREPELDPHHSKRRARALFEPKIVRRAILDSFVKLDPRLQAKNPVMFIVEVGSVLTTFLFFRDLSRVDAATSWFAGLVAAFLWFTVLFANFAEAMAEGRGKAQAETLRKTRVRDGRVRPPARRLGRRDGRRASSRSAICASCGPASSSPVTATSSKASRRSTSRRSPASRRPSSASRVATASAVTGGTRVLSDEIVVKITSQAGRDVPRPDDRARRGRRTAEDAERDRAQHPARRPDDHLHARGRHAAAVRDLLGRAAVDRRARRACWCASSPRRSARCSRRSASPAWTGSCSATCSR